MMNSICLQMIQCVMITMKPLYNRINFSPLTIDTAQIACYGKIRSVFCKFQVWSLFYLYTEMGI